MSDQSIFVPSQHGRRAVITGTGGLGLETARALSRMGADIVLAGRNSQAGAAAVAQLRSENSAARVRFEQVDLADLASIGAFAGRLIEDNIAIEILVCNAGIMSPPKRRTTKDGFEMQFGVNYLGHFALVAQLLPLLRRNVGARVVSVTSLAQHYAKPDLNDLQSEISYVPGKAYCVSKFAQAVFAQELQRRSDTGHWGLQSVGAHPGMARTNLFNAEPASAGGLKGAATWAMGHLLGQSATDGAAPTVYAATSPEAVGGTLYGPKGLFEMKGPPGVAKFAKASQDSELASRLWDISEALARVHFPDGLVKSAAPRAGT